MTEEPTPSVAARDDLAGVVDLFESLTREELSRALSELAFKRREAVDEAVIEATIDAAVTEYAIVPAPPETVSVVDAGPDSGGDVRGAAEAEASFLAVGPAAFPSLPDGAADLPYILDIPDRTVDREALSSAVLDRLSAEAVTAIDEGDAERLEVLVDVTYDIESWAAVDAGPIRERIVAELDD
ncbi:MAG: hypothetical protein PPP55_01365 [Halorubrum sp.]